MDSDVPQELGLADTPRVEVALVPPSSPYGLLVKEATEAAGGFYVPVDSASPVDLAERVLVVDLTQVMASQPLGPRVIAITDSEGIDCYDLVRPDEVFTRLPRAVRNLVEREQFRARMGQQKETVGLLNKIGQSLSAITDLNELLDAILTHVREALRADAGTIYLRENDTEISFSAAQNDTVKFEAKKSLLPINDQSLAGFVANRGQVLNIDDVYQIAKDTPYQPNLSFDEMSGYRTRSTLLVPMTDRSDRVLGVLALVNRKHQPGVPLADFGLCLPFSDSDVELAMSIASQAAVALENYALYKNIRMLFDDFVSAAVTVIESRDPSTAGHSERVARLTVTLAEACSASDEPVFSDVQYSPRGLEELRYASLLHDFGKVGVREEVLLKANKLYPWELERIEWRFRVASVQATLETDFRELSGKGPSERKDLLGHDLHVIREMNKPNYQFQNEDVDQIQGIAQRWSLGDSGEPTLDQAEVTRLCIPYGSLDPLERKEIERHVEHTYQFLRLIPWTEDLQGVPDIAHAHHEKLDGSGYPLGLAGTKIPYGAKLMAISDIFDALTASDRPYKPALGEGKAISILRSEAERQHLEHEAVELFVGARLWERAGITLTLS